MTPGDETRDVLVSQLVSIIDYPYLCSLSAPRLSPIKIWALTFACFAYRSSCTVAGFLVTSVMPTTHCVFRVGLRRVPPRSKHSLVEPNPLSVIDWPTLRLLIATMFSFFVKSSLPPIISLKFDDDRHGDPSSRFSFVFRCKPCRKDGNEGMCNVG